MSNMKQTTPEIPYLRISSFGQTAWIDLDESSNALIGAGSHCKIQIKGGDVRSLHCIVAMKDGRLEVRDWNTGCTFVNGQAINEPTELKEGDSLKIGDHEIIAVLSESGHAEVQALMTADAETQSDDQTETPIGQTDSVENAAFETPTPREEPRTLSMADIEAEVEAAVEAEAEVEVEVEAEAEVEVEVEAEVETETEAEVDDQVETPVNETVESETAELETLEPLAETPTMVVEATEAEVHDQPEEPVGEADEVETAELETDVKSESLEEPAFESVDESEVNAEPVAVQEDAPAVESEIQYEFSPEPEVASPVSATEVEPATQEEMQVPVEFPVPVDLPAPVQFRSPVESEIQVEVIGETEADTQPAVAPAEFVYDIDADFEDEADDLTFGLASAGFADDMVEAELQTLRMENEQLRFELNEQAQRSSSSEANSELLSREQTVRLVSRLEDMLAELKRSDARSLQLEELLRSADQATQDEHDERKQIEEWVSELESRITQRESESNSEIQSLKKLLEEARESQQKSNDSLQSVIASRAGDGEAVPDELLSGLRQQIESLQTQLQSSQEECTSLREQLENRSAEASEDSLEQAQQKLAEARLEASRERAEVSRQRVELQRLRAELEERLNAPREANDADTRIRAMREHLKELHDEGEKAKANQPISAVSSGLANRISSLLQRVAGE